MGAGCSSVKRLWGAGALRLLGTQLQEGLLGGRPPPLSRLWGLSVKHTAGLWG